MPRTMQGFHQGLRALYISIKRLNIKLDALLVSTAHFLFLYDKQERSLSCAAETMIKTNDEGCVGFSGLQDQLIPAPPPKC